MSPEAPELTQRQRIILEYVVEEYVGDGQPVGSKSLTARRGMDVSASTVRYDLADLEELGLLTHPHTSAGRVPTISVTGSTSTSFSLPRAVLGSET